MKKKKRHIPIIVVLDTMWGEGCTEAPRFFYISPQNHSGKRLYKLLGEQRFLVTNCCSVQTDHARKHGTPDVDWLEENLRRYTCDKLLLCGKVAQKTFDKIGYGIRICIGQAKTFRLPHPAARNWTKQKILEWKEKLA